MLQRIRSNFGLKTLSVLLAVLGWAYFRFSAYPAVAARFDQRLSVPVTAANLPSGYVARFSQREASVTIESRPGDAPVKSGDVKAVLDLSNRVPGVYNVPVQLVAPNVAVRSLSPASVTLTIESAAHASASP